VLGSRTYCVVLSNKAWIHVETSGAGIRSVEVQVILILPVVSCFSVCRIREGLCCCLVMGPHGCLLGTSDLPSSGS
jgi:hypothetical protein